MRRLPVCLVCISNIIFIAIGRSGFGEEGAPADARTEWEFVGQRDKAKRSFRRLKPKQWVLTHPQKDDVSLTELERNDEQIILQNDRSKLIYRLTTGRGYWRRPNDDPDDWKTWVKGSWVEPSSPTPEKKPQEYVVKLGYFVPQDRTPIPNYDRKIRVVMNIVAELYRTDLQAKGYETDGFEFELENGEPVVYLIRGAKTAGHYNNAPAYEGNEQWRRLVPEIREALGSTDDQVLVVFAETYDHGRSEYLWPGVLARGAYYSADGGLGIYTSHILKDEFCALSLQEQRKKFFDRTPVAGRRALGHGRNSPRCEFTEDGIGAVAHELGHAFGLPHDRRKDNVYIMGNGFRNLRQNFSWARSRHAQFSPENARLLMSSRYLNPRLDMRDDTPAEVTLNLVSRRRSQLIARISARDAGGLNAIVFTDMNGGTIIDGKELTGNELVLEHPLPKVEVRKGRVKVRAIVTDTGGNQTRVTATLAVR